MSARSSIVSMPILLCIILFVILGTDNDSNDEFLGFDFSSPSPFAYSLVGTSYYIVFRYFYNNNTANTMSLQHVKRSVVNFLFFITHMY
jgi:hypothetical protein